MPDSLWFKEGANDCTIARCDVENLRPCASNRGKPSASSHQVLQPCQSATPICLSTVGVEDLIREFGARA